VLDVVAEKYPQAYFAGMVSLARREMVLWSTLSGRATADCGSPLSSSLRACSC
jgi:hypothetical protein